MALSIIKEMKIPTNDVIICLNTKFIYDIILGCILENPKGENVLNGGIPPCFNISGRNGLYKSTQIYSMLVSMLNIYPDSEAIVYETENNLSSTQRFNDLAKKNISDRIGLFPNHQYDLESVSEKIKEIGNFKLEHKKDFTIETPFYDYDEKKYITMLIPTFIVIDSFTIAKSPIEKENIDTNTLCDSKNNLLFMQDGMTKTRFMNNVIEWAKKYGMYFLFTAQIGNKKDLNPMQPTPKQFQYMSKIDQVKSVGSRFEFLINSFIQTKTCNVIQDDKKECYYPLDDGSSPLEVNEVTSVIVRCKHSEGGELIPVVCSQREGVLRDITNLHYLRTNKFGIRGVRALNTVLLPDKKFDRFTAREKIGNDYELSRAIEILTHYCYIKENWSHKKFKSIDLNMNDEEFAEKLINNKSYLISDILNSRGYWTYDKNEKRPYLSIVDVLKLIKK